MSAYADSLQFEPARKKKQLALPQLSLRKCENTICDV